MFPRHLHLFEPDNVEGCSTPHGPSRVVGRRCLPHCAQGLIQIGDQVICILDADRQAHQILRGPATTSPARDGGSIVGGITGIGIRSEDLTRLFKPFIQLDASLARKNKGTGLGPVLVKQITELLGGGVSLESDVGKGSRFTMTLPWVE